MLQQHNKFTLTADLHFIATNVSTLLSKYWNLPLTCHGVKGFPWRCSTDFQVSEAKGPVWGHCFSRWETRLSWIDPICNSYCLYLQNKSRIQLFSPPSLLPELGTTAIYCLDYQVASSPASCFLPRSLPGWSPQNPRQTASLHSSNPQWSLPQRESQRPSTY